MEVNSVDMTRDWRSQKVVKQDGRWVIEGHPSNKHEIAWNVRPSNMPDMAYIGLKVTAPVNAATPSHKHGGAAVTATVVKGQILNQMICSDGIVIGPQVYHQGDSWYEAPGCHHVRCENVGSEEAVFVAGFVIDASLVEAKGVIGAIIQFDADADQMPG